MNGKRRGERISMQNSYPLILFIGSDEKINGIYSHLSFMINLSLSKIEIFSISIIAKICDKKWVTKGQSFVSLNDIL